MKSVLILILVFPQNPDSGTTSTPVPTDHEREGLVGVIREIVEQVPVALVAKNWDYKSYHNPPNFVEEYATIGSKSYDIQGNIVTDYSTNRHGWTMTRRYKMDANGRLEMCYEPFSAINSAPPPLARHPVYKNGCGESYIFHREYKIKYERIGNQVVKIGSSLEAEVRAGGELAWRTKDFYDAQGRLIESIKSNVLDDNYTATVHRSLYTYNDQEKVPATFELQIDGNTRGKAWYEYGFDSRGNWIKREVKKSEGDPVTINKLIRKITYY